MSSSSDTLTRQLRLWPGLLLLGLQWLLRFVVPTIFPDALAVGVFAGLICGVGILIWWAFFSRAPMAERWLGVALMVASVLAMPWLLHESVATGNMGMMFPIYALPTLSLALVAWAAISRTRPWPSGVRRATLVAAMLLGGGIWALVRTGGNTTGLDHDFAWRWQPTPEERLLAQEDDSQSSASVPVADLAASEASWPGFRGPERDSILNGVTLETDWSANPPQELWRRSIGPGWSSFAVRGDVFYTQEQRGEEEIVSCYRLSTGEPVWKHRDAARFWESVGGAGPRGTPTLVGDRVYTLGGTGLLNVLNAFDGTEIWSRDAAKDTETELPTWAYSGSPLVLEDQVVVAASGALISYDLDSGDIRWKGPAGGEGYSSPHLATLGGVPQILQLHGDGLIGVAPADGSLLWQHDWSGYPIVQPALTADGDVLISVNSDSGIRRIHISRSGDGWKAEEKWSTIRLKPYFNDFVIHKRHAYGFDGTILAAIDVDGGDRKWKGGRYGGGQLMLLADQDLLLVLSEKGEVALVNAKPDGFQELARFQAIQGKTWNHPVLSGETLLVRNAEEMAAFKIQLKEG